MNRGYALVVPTSKGIPSAGAITETPERHTHSNICRGSIMPVNKGFRIKGMA